MLRLTEDAANRIKVAVLPCIDAVLSDPSRLSLIAVVVACYVRYVARQTDDLGADYAASTDPATEPLYPLAAEALRGDSEATASFLRDALGDGLAPAFVARVQELVAELGRPGATCRGVVEETLRAASL